MGSCVLTRFISSTYLDNKKNIALYRASNIEETEAVKLTHSGLVLIALLCGGDYDQV